MPARGGQETRRRPPRPARYALDSIYRRRRYFVSFRAFRLLAMPAPGDAHLFQASRAEYYAVAATHFGQSDSTAYYASPIG